jgi:hypothetical protein
MRIIYKFPPLRGSSLKSEGLIGWIIKKAVATTAQIKKEILIGFI